MFSFFRKKECVKELKKEPKFNFEEINNFGVYSEPNMGEDIDEFIVEQIQVPIEEKTTREIELELFVGSLVISVSKNIENPRVGVVVEVTHSNHSHIPLLLIYDIVKKEKFIPDGVIFSHTDQKFEALNQIEPNARIAIFFHRIDGNIVKKPINNFLYSPEDWRLKVTEAVKKINNGDWN